MLSKQTPNPLRNIDPGAMLQAGSTTEMSTILGDRQVSDIATVKEEIFVGEKFRTFPPKTFRIEFNFVLSN